MSDHHNLEFESRTPADTVGLDEHVVDVDVVIKSTHHLANRLLFYVERKKMNMSMVTEVNLSASSITELEPSPSGVPATGPHNHTFLDVHGNPAGVTRLQAGRPVTKVRKVGEIRIVVDPNVDERHVPREWGPWIARPVASGQVAEQPQTFAGAGMDMEGAQGELLDLFTTDPGPQGPVGIPGPLASDGPTEMPVPDQLPAPEDPVDWQATILDRLAQMRDAIRQNNRQLQEDEGWNHASWDELRERSGLFRQRIIDRLQREEVEYEAQVEARSQALGEEAHALNEEAMSSTTAPEEDLEPAQQFGRASTSEEEEEEAQPPSSPGLLGGIMATISALGSGQPNRNGDIIAPEALMDTIHRQAQENADASPLMEHGGANPLMGLQVREATDAQERLMNAMGVQGVVMPPPHLANVPISVRLDERGMPIGIATIEREEEPPPTPARPAWRNEDGTARMGIFNLALFDLLEEMAFRMDAWAHCPTFMITEWRIGALGTMAHDHQAGGVNPGSFDSVGERTSWTRRAGEIQSYLRGVRDHIVDMMDRLSSSEDGDALTGSIDRGARSTIFDLCRNSNFGPMRSAVASFDFFWTQYQNWQEMEAEGQAEWIDETRQSLTPGGSGGTQTSLEVFLNMTFQRPDETLVEMIQRGWRFRHRNGRTYCLGDFRIPQGEAFVELGIVCLGEEEGEPDTTRQIEDYGGPPTVSAYCSVRAAAERIIAAVSEQVPAATLQQPGRTTIPSLEENPPAFGPADELYDDDMPF